MCCIRLELRATMLLLLLAGGECVRTHNQLTTMKASRSNVSDVDLWFNSGGNDVCRKADLKKDDSSAIDRYKEKTNRIDVLAYELGTPRCKKSCLGKVIELSKRIDKLRSCGKVLTEMKVHDDLLDMMFNSEQHTLLQLMQESLTGLGKWLKHAGYFPAHGDCEFNPANLNIDTALGSPSPKEEIRKQLFGDKCTVQNQQQYIKKLKSHERKFANRLLETANQGVDLRTKAENNFEQAMEESTGILGEIKRGSESSSSLELNATEMSLAEADDSELEGSTEIATILMVLFAVLAIVALVIVFQMISDTDKAGSEMSGYTRNVNNHNRAVARYNQNVVKYNRDRR